MQTLKIQKGLGLWVLSGQVLLVFVSLSISQPTQSTPSQVADFWGTVFNGTSPNGLPPLNATRINFRVIDNVSLWEVYFDSYQDPDTRQPYRQRAVFGVPNNIPAPGPNGKFPGLVTTHSVGVANPKEGESTAIYFAKLGFATLAMYLRKYNEFEGFDFDDFCPQVAGQTTMAYYDNTWTGMAADIYQAAEWMAQQSEVWQPDSLAFTGHSGGGYATMVAGLFNPRYKILAAVAPPATTPDVPGWVDYMGFCPDFPTADVYRMASFIGTYQAINNPNMTAVNPDWNLDNTHIFIYGGQNDPAVSPAYLQSTYEYLDESNCKAFHWSPTGGHGGPESFSRTLAWLNGHYLERPQTGPTAVLEVASQNGREFTFSGEGSTDNDVLISWEYDFGDGTSRNWGGTTNHLYASDGIYEVRLIVTDGACLRDTVWVTVNAGGTTRPTFVVGASDSLWVREGGTISFTLSLTAAPASNLSVTVAPSGGDGDLSVQSGGNITFSPANWNQSQTVVLAAAQDADQTNGSATVSITATDVPTVNLTVTEIEDDATLGLAAGNANGIPGDTVWVPIVLSNPSAMGISAIRFTAVRDIEALSNPWTGAGPGLPPKEEWFLTQESREDSQVVDAGQFAGPEFQILSGEVFYLRYVVDSGAPPGNYPVTLSAGRINGSLTPDLAPGSVNVTTTSIGNGVKGLPARARLFTDPATGEIWLDYVMANPNNPLQIRMYSIDGRMLATLYSGIPESPKGKINLSKIPLLRELDGRLHIIQVESNGVRRAEKVMVLP